MSEATPSLDSREGATIVVQDHIRWLETHDRNTTAQALKTLFFEMGKECGQTCAELTKQRDALAKVCESILSDPDEVIVKDERHPDGYPEGRACIFLSLDDLDALRAALALAREPEAK